MKLPLPTVALLLCAMATTAPAADPCRPQCQQTREEQIVNCAKNKKCLTTAKEARTRCRRNLNSCLKGCRPLAQGAPGRCTLVRGCAKACREALGSHADCNRRFDARLKKLCTRKCVRSAVTVNSCVAEFRHADFVCTTSSTSTTSSTTSTSTSLTTTSTTEPAPGASTTSTTMVLAPTPIETDPSSLGCRACILTVASLCYLACEDNCSGDADALGVCHTGCRDAQCERLEDACGPECANCVVTTTSTSSTSTSIATTSTSSTTLIGGPTTTSTTIAGL